MLKYILRFSLLLCIFSYASGIKKSFSQTNIPLATAIKQVYGEASNSFSKTQMDWLANQMERSIIQKTPRVNGENIPLLSKVGVISKFIPSLQTDDFSNPQSVNPLKYNIDFFKPQDQLFRIDGTDYVLFIAGKK